VPATRTRALAVSVADEKKLETALGESAAKDLYKSYTSGRFASVEATTRVSEKDKVPVIKTLRTGGVRDGRGSIESGRCGMVLAPPSKLGLVNQREEASELERADSASLLEVAASTLPVAASRTSTPTATGTGTASGTATATGTPTTTPTPTATASLTASATPHRQINPMWPPHSGTGLGYTDPLIPGHCANKYSPVGSVGFFVTSAGGNKYIVTNRHVVEAFPGGHQFVLQYHWQDALACGEIAAPVANWNNPPGAPTRVGTIPVGSTSLVHDLGIVRLDPANSPDYSCSFPASGQVVIPRGVSPGWINAPVRSHTVAARGAATVFNAVDYLTGALKAFNYLTRRNVMKGGARTGYTEGMIT